MDAILNDDVLELKGYVLNSSADLCQAEILVTNCYGKGEAAVVVADVNFKYETIFEWHTLDGYAIHRHDAIEGFVRRIISLLWFEFNENKEPEDDEE